MDQKILKELCNNLNNRGGSIPAYPIPEMFTLLEALFTEEEAKVACEMPPTATSLRDLADILSRPAEDIFPLLESMADKGVVATRKKDDVVLYKLLPVAPGIFEFQFMRGGDTDRDRYLARLLRGYVDAAAMQLKKDFSVPENITPFMRVIPVEETINPQQRVYTFEQISQYIDSADAIAVGHCYCHHEAYLLGKEACDAPEFRCMNFGPGALYTSERGITRLIGKEEARKIVEECAEKGLVHMGSNTSKYLEFLCNCCICHCGMLQSLSKIGEPNLTANSGYIAEVDGERCEGCGSCVEICPIHAISFDDSGERAFVDQVLCIGCGLCTHHCPANVVSMNLREEYSPPPETPKDLRKAVMDDFIKAHGDQK